jgi:hypothetical protein
MLAYLKPSRTVRLFRQITKMTSEITIPSFQDRIVRLPGISQESKETVKYLLEKNHQDNHLYFNKDGFHK